VPLTTNPTAHVTANAHSNKPRLWISKIQVQIFGSKLGKAFFKLNNRTYYIILQKDTIRTLTDEMISSGNSGKSKGFVVKEIALCLKQGEEGSKFQFSVKTPSEVLHVMSTTPPVTMWPPDNFLTKEEFHETPGDVFNEASEEETEEESNEPMLSSISNNVVTIGDEGIEDIETGEDALQTETTSASNCDKEKKSDCCIS
jgi:hypothetical protein